jgi:hypothetical protein
MKERSQLEDMRAALQGDLERARERRGATLLDPEAESAPDLDLDLEPRAEVPDSPEEAPEVDVQVADTHEPDPEPTPRRRFLWFLRD